MIEKRIARTSEKIPVLAIFCSKGNGEKLEKELLFTNGVSGHRNA
jgi:hypothetical protein